MTFLLKNKVSLNIVCFQMEKSLIQEMFPFVFIGVQKYLGYTYQQINISIILLLNAAT